MKKANCIMGADEIDKEQLQAELDFLKTELERYETLINLTENEDLIEAYIYESKAMQIRYGYLIKLARENKINIDFIERCS